MITGASQAEAAILIVDVTEGVQEQTRRHGYILSMLGIEQLIVVVNKMDMVEDREKRFEETKQQLEKLLDTLGLSTPYIVPVSAKEGWNIASTSDELSWYKGRSILELLDEFKPEDEPIGKPLRFPLQDVYKIDQNRILVGKVENGVIEQGQEVLFLPSGKRTKTSLRSSTGCALPRARGRRLPSSPNAR